MPVPPPAPDLTSLSDQLLALRDHDLAVRSELASDGSLYEGYHPRMEAVHRAQAAELRAIIDSQGWPDETQVGPDAAQAAWLVAQHAISEPGFMRRCRNLIDEASLAGRVPRWQFAYIDDRIRVFEGRPQHYGTQFDLTPQGPVVETLEDASQVDALRREVGLGPVSEMLERAGGNPLPTAEAYAASRAAGHAWRRHVGWLP
jgi:hypothetical protein